jgi:hypothetical protein
VKGAATPSFVGPAATWKTRRLAVPDMDLVAIETIKGRAALLARRALRRRTAADGVARDGGWEEFAYRIEHDDRREERDDHS